MNEISTSGNQSYESIILGSLCTITTGNLDIHVTDEQSQINFNCNVNYQPGVILSIYGNSILQQDNQINTIAYLFEGNHFIYGFHSNLTLLLGNGVIQGSGYLNTLNVDSGAQIIPDRVLLGDSPLRIDTLTFIDDETVEIIFELKTKGDSNLLT